VVALLKECKTYGVTMDQEEMKEFRAGENKMVVPPTKDGIIHSYFTIT